MHRTCRFLAVAALFLAACATDDAREGAHHQVSSATAEECAQGATCCPDPQDPGVQYIGNSDVDPSVCDTIGIWQCADGWQLFTGDCGCGCLLVDETPDEPTCDCDCGG